jgi:hypothetical protein
VKGHYREAFKDPVLEGDLLMSVMRPPRNFSACVKEKRQWLD